MLASLKVTLLFAAGVGGAAVLWPLCGAGLQAAGARLKGVYSASVTLDDGLGVVRCDPRQVSPPQIAAHLTKLTGFGATILPDTTRAPGGGR
ncbi:MAG: hypothetical protein DMD76_09380 [Candidatus Rokuibacteriota bacterium]|nr:MAG: hypothetical protein DMD76_09380 [Candidatus Rokubacteria bacterium]